MRNAEESDTLSLGAASVALASKVGHPGAALRGLGARKMIKANVFYPNGADTKFDMDYYLTKHMPLVKESFGSALKGASVDQGIAGGMPGSPATYAAVCSLLFDSVGDLQAGMAANAAKLMADIPNFTNVHPTIQVSEVKM